jgi:hypothetical protein
MRRTIPGALVDSAGCRPIKFGKPFDQEGEQKRFTMFDQRKRPLLLLLFTALLLPALLLAGCGREAASGQETNSQGKPIVTVYRAPT